MFHLKCLGFGETRFEQAPMGPKTSKAHELHRLFDSSDVYCQELQAPNHEFSGVSLFFITFQGSVVAIRVGSLRRSCLHAPSVRGRACTTSDFPVLTFCLLLGWAGKGSHASFLSRTR